jgi:hypothetical protein
MVGPSCGETEVSESQSKGQDVDEERQHREGGGRESGG